MKQLTDEDVRAVGGIVHRDGNVFFTNVAMLNKAVELAAQPELEEANSMLLARNKWLEHTLEVAGASPVEPSQDQPPATIQRSPAPALLRNCFSLLESFDYENDEDSPSNAFFKAYINTDWFFHVKNSIERQLNTESENETAN